MYNELVKKLDYISDLSQIEKAYQIASHLHKNQLRDSKEEYITHPLSVAKTIASMKGDEDAICAALLHDTVEDTAFTLEDIAYEFNKTVAYLVDGVTKEKKEFKSSIEREIYNTDKLVLYSTHDIRVMIIKLSDRLHNMSTLEYKKHSSIISNSKETMMFYVPISSMLGMRKMRRNLEDFAFKYLDNENYEKAYLIRKNILYYSNIHYLLRKVKNYIENTKIKGNIYVKYDGILESHQKIKNGLDNLFTIYIITDEYIPFKGEYIKSITYDEFNKKENGIASNFDNINEEIEELKNSLLEFNSDYSRKLLEV